jgi:CHAT domain-containing protein
MRGAALLLLFLTGCGPQSSDSIYQQSKSSLDRGELKAALASADAGLRREPSWRFRLLKAEILLANGDAPGAVEALRAPNPPDSEELRARLAMYQGQAKYLLSDYAGAEAELNRAMEIAKGLKQPLLDSQIELRRGVLMFRSGHAAESEELFRKVFRDSTALGDLYLQAAALGNLGVQLLSTHHPDQAIYWLERARDVSERLGSAASVAKAIGNLGSCYQHLGDHERALGYLRDAESRFRAVGNRYEQQICLGNIGNVLNDQSDFPAAADKYSAALAIARDYGDSWTGTWLSDLAIASIGAGNFDNAERYNDEALLVKKRLPGSFDFQARVNRARITAGRNDLTGAERLYRTLLDEGSTDATSTLDAEAGLAELLVKKGDIPKADAQFRSALALIERQRASLVRDEYKLSYFSGLIRFYQDYVDFLVANGQTGKALEVAESSRARVLDEKLHSGVKTRDVNAASLQQIARSSNSVLLSYWLAPQRSFLWVVTPTAVTMYMLPSDKKIAALVGSYGTLLENLRDPLDSESTAGRELSEILLGPVRPQLRPGVRIVMVADRALHSLNFETLPDPDHPSQYLIDNATISIAPSLGVLGGARDTSTKSDGSILLIGDPEPAVEEYPRLPYATKEMALIEQNFATGRSVVVQGARATPAAYRDNDPARFSFVHFAAHAAANRESPLDSALILSRHESGYALSARDVMNVPLRADLVTLSACRSAGARMYSGEGLVGLSWAFLRAGARNVVAGLWDVNDMSTANLMSDFYGRLTKGAAPADALREAKLKLVHSKGAYRKPFYWGPFQLYTGSGLTH